MRIFFNLCLNAHIDIPIAYFINEKKKKKKFDVYGSNHVDISATAVSKLE
jgi:hypothetical protein